jgi:hypothetical protein
MCRLSARLGSAPARLITRTALPLRGTVRQRASSAYSAGDRRVGADRLRTDSQRRVTRKLRGIMLPMIGSHDGQRKGL